ncbi:MAG: alpha-L-fucosidase [Candidatus Sumerlaeota bacterium]|nr:alpha-L-fucosidase [Candidatus Sumerlaeota bacterium]
MVTIEPETGDRKRITCSKFCIGIGVCLALLRFVPVHSAEPPAPFGATPSECQLRWHEMDFYGFVRFRDPEEINEPHAFHEKKIRPLNSYNPSAFDADQITSTAKAIGMKGLILSCQEPDGFCWWPSRYTDRSVKNSPWHDGKGDLVREMADSCRRRGLKFGIHLSLWNNRHNGSKDPKKFVQFRDLLSELLGNYGDLFETEVLSFDGRCTDSVLNQIREMQPGACIMDRFGPDLRLAGRAPNNSNGSDHWATINIKQLISGKISSNEADEKLPRGDRGGSQWIPAEFQTPLSQFVSPYSAHAKEYEIKVTGQLLRAYYATAGRGAAWNMEIALDRQGRPYEWIFNSLNEMRQTLDRTFATNLARRAKITAISHRHESYTDEDRKRPISWPSLEGKKDVATTNSYWGRDSRYAIENIVDGNISTYWMPEEAAISSELIFDFGTTVAFNVVCLREFLPLGQRVSYYTTEFWDANKKNEHRMMNGQTHTSYGRWIQCNNGSSIGARRYMRSDLVTFADRVRVTFYHGFLTGGYYVPAPNVCPAISEIGFYLESPDLPLPRITRPPRGWLVGVSISSMGSALIRYTLDGSEPDAKSPIYRDSVPLPRGGIMRARACSADSTQMGPVRTMRFGISKAKWNVVDTNKPPIVTRDKVLFDAKSGIGWNATTKQNKNPSLQSAVFDMGEMVMTKGFIITYTANPLGPPDNQAVARYEIFLSSDGQDWGQAVAAGEIPASQDDPAQIEVKLAKAAAGRYFKFCPELTSRNQWVRIPEPDVTGE